jgi:hypothetical protein
MSTTTRPTPAAVRRIVKAALRRAALSPEAFARQYPEVVYGAKARAIRYWMDGTSTPHPATVERLRQFAEHG